ncbi:MAG: cadherin domain-containing protein, partial [Microscillaceae bacterium]|nr:cadherin domain-containing protein [Microscillaceae bacterium]
MRALSKLFFYFYLGYFNYRNSLIRGLSLGLCLLFVGSASSAQNILTGNYPNWTRIADALTRRVEAQGSVAYNNKLYLFCGFDTAVNASGQRYLVVNRNTESFDPATSTWSTLAPLPDPAGITHYGAALVGDKVWLVGGRLNATRAVTNKVWIYDITQNTWASGPNLPKNLASGVLLKLGRKLHFFAGGTHETNNVNKLCVMTSDYYTLNLDNVALGWQSGEFTPLPPHIQTIHASGVQLGGRFYLMGGQYGHDCNNDDPQHSNVFRFDPYLNEWEKVASLPAANSHTEGSSFAIDGKIYCVGGEDTGDYVTEYNPETNTWRVADLMKNESNSPLRLIGPGAKVIQNKLIVATGGSDMFTFRPTKKTFVKNFTRTPSNILRFLPDTVHLNVNRANPIIQKSAWLYTLNGTATYAVNLTNLPSWLSISRDAGNTVDETAAEFRLTVNATSLNAGNYTYTLPVTASGYNNTQLVIRLTVANQTPTISSASFTLAENAPVGTSLGNVVASDADANQSLTYAIIAGNTNNTFKINASTGEITLDKALNFNALASYNLTVRASDNGSPSLSASANVAIT